MIIAGVDEAGRGPLAGPVVAAAVILNPDVELPLKDSKKLTEKKRNFLYDEICRTALSYSIAEASVYEIDTMNILQATMLAMQRAVCGLKYLPDLVRVDGNKAPDLNVKVEAIIKGDDKHAEISAASILAKVTRDRKLYELDEKFPEYQFKKHKGYPTKLHMQVLKELGPCSEHRLSYRPVKESIIA